MTTSCGGWADAQIAGKKRIDARQQNVRHPSKLRLISAEVEADSVRLRLGLGLHLLVMPGHLQLIRIHIRIDIH